MEAYYLRLELKRDSLVSRVRVNMSGNCRGEISRVGDGYGFEESMEVFKRESENLKYLPGLEKTSAR